MIQEYINQIFNGIYEDNETKKQKQELALFLEEKVIDLVGEGMDKSRATQKVIKDFGSVEQVRKELGLIEDKDYFQFKKRVQFLNYISFITMIMAIEFFYGSYLLGLGLPTAFFSWILLTTIGTFIFVYNYVYSKNYLLKHQFSQANLFKAIIRLRANWIKAVVYFLIFALLVIPFYLTISNNKAIDINHTTILKHISILINPIISLLVQQLFLSYLVFMNSVLLINWYFSKHFKLDTIPLLERIKENWIVNTLIFKVPYVILLTYFLSVNFEMFLTLQLLLLVILIEDLYTIIKYKKQLILYISRLLLVVAVLIPIFYTPASVKDVPYDFIQLFVMWSNLALLIVILSTFIYQVTNKRVKDKILVYYLLIRMFSFLLLINLLNLSFSTLFVHYETKEPVFSLEINNKNFYIYLFVYLIIETFVRILSKRQKLED